MDSSESGEVGVIGLLDVVVMVCILVVVVILIVRCTKRKKEQGGLRKLSVGVNLGRPVVGGPDGVGGSFLSKMKTRNKRVVIFYGSQTGTAEEFSSRLAKDATRYGIPAMVFDPEEVSEWENLANMAKEIENSLAIFCMATYGEGDPTDNAQDFFTWLQDADEDLTGLNYTVFGLGNKTYEHFNAMGILVDKKLEKMGATRIYEIGEGDDDGNIEEDFVTWKEDLWSTVCQRFGIEASQQDNVAREYELTEHSEGDLPSERIFSGEPHRLGTYNNQKPPYNAKNPYLSTIQVIRELHHGGERSCMHVELDITGSKLNYVAGDHVALFPINNPKHVERIGELLQTDLDAVVTLTNVDEHASKLHPFPCPTSYRTALSHYVDITSSPRTNVLRELADHASDPTHKDFLMRITSATEEGKREYSEWIIKDKRTIIQVLEDLPSFKPPLDYLLELLPRLQARYYSISSSPRLYPNSVHITAVLVEYETQTGRVNQGVATSWLKRFQKNNNGTPLPRVPIFIRHSSLRLPYRSTCPVIMVGPGTGIAPFRGFIQDRKFAKDSNKALGSTILYFGCRKESEDYLYQEELEGYKKEEVLKELHVAFSRDKEEKVYVQHLMEKTGKEMYALLEQQAYFYVCGDARNMARSVQSTLVQILEEHGGMSNQEAVEYIKKLQKRGRYLQDVWS